jgi:heme exporter protein D
MTKKWLIILVALLFVGCGQEEREYVMQGVWTLQSREYPGGGRSEITSEDEDAHGLIYDGDSMVYVCRLIRTPSGLVMTPMERGNVTVVNKGGGEFLYLEDDNPRPLVMLDDSTMTIQREGVKYGYRRADDINDEWWQDMRDIVANKTGTVDEEPTNYVFSAKEREQASTINWMAFILVAAGLGIVVVVNLLVNTNRSRRRLLAQLQQIREEHEERPQTVRTAMRNVEDEFFASDEYIALHHRITRGERLTDEDWREMEERLKRVYPGFTSRLRNLYPMSELEYHQVCLLIKLRITPTEMADVLSRDGSTISTVRSRLYKKVFGRKGGARDWDEFVLSIGA